MQLMQTKNRRSYFGALLLPLLALLALFVGLLAFRFSYAGNLRIALLPDMYCQPQLPPTVIVYIPWVLLILCIIIAVLLPGINFPDKIKPWAIGTQSIIVVVLLWAGIVFFGDRASYKVKKLDYFARNEQWDNIISDSGNTDIRNYLHLNYLNLALAQKGELLDKMFTFNQRGVSSLKLPNERKNLTSAVLSDIYFCVGDIASSQQVAFEGFEKSPANGNPRLLKRLVQTNLVLCNYEVAKKYIAILKHTLFYRNWAKKHGQYLNNDELCANDTVLGKRINFLPKKNSRFYTTGGAETFDKLVKINPKNQNAFEYFFAYLLLSKNLKLIYNYSLKYKNASYLPKHLPLYFQQAILMCYETDDREWEKWNINKETIKQYKTYRYMVIKNEKNPELPNLMKKYFESTYWYYYQFVNIK
jgi:hypothetical protein